VISIFDERDKVSVNLYSHSVLYLGEWFDSFVKDLSRAVVGGIQMKDWTNKKQEKNSFA
jgi:hypothetical protein